MFCLHVFVPGGGKEGGCLQANIPMCVWAAAANGDCSNVLCQHQVGKKQVGADANKKNVSKKGHLSLSVLYPDTKKQQSGMMMQTLKKNKLLVLKFSNICSNRIFWQDVTSLKATRNNPHLTPLSRQVWARSVVKLAQLAWHAFCQHEACVSMMALFCRWHSTNGPVVVWYMWVLAHPWTASGKLHLGHQKVSILCCTWVEHYCSGKGHIRPYYTNCHNNLLHDLWNIYHVKYNHTIINITTREILYLCFIIPVCIVILRISNQIKSLDFPTFFLGRQLRSK